MRCKVSQAFLNASHRKKFENHCSKGSNTAFIVVSIPLFVRGFQGRSTTKTKTSLSNFQLMLKTRSCLPSSKAWILQDLDHSSSGKLSINSVQLESHFVSQNPACDSRDQRSFTMAIPVEESGTLSKQSSTYKQFSTTLATYGSNSIPKSFADCRKAKVAQDDNEFAPNKCTVI